MIIKKRGIMQYAVKQLGFSEGDTLDYLTRFDTLPKAISYMKRKYETTELWLQQLRDDDELDFKYKQKLVIDGINSKYHHFAEGGLEGDSEITYTIITVEDVKAEPTPIAKKMAKIDPKGVTTETIDDMSDEELYAYFGSSFEYDCSRAVIRANFKTLKYTIEKDAGSEDAVVDAYNRTTPKKDEVIICALGTTFY